MLDPAAIAGCRGGGLLGTVGAQAEQFEGLGLDRRGSRDDGEGGVGIGRRARDVVGQGGQILEQRPEAVQRQAVCGRLVPLSALADLS